VSGKTLILVDNDKEWLSEGMAATGLVDVARVYRPVSYWGRRLRTLHYHTKLAKEYWYADWTATIQNYERVILFDVFLDSDVAEYIENKAPHARLIIFYRNPWFNNYYVSAEARKKCEVWSFDQEDCKKYGLKYNPQFYLYSLLNQKEDPRYASDVFFVGKDKNRLPLLLEIKDRLEAQALKMQLYVVGERNVHYNKSAAAFIHGDLLAYEEVLKYTKNTKCLLELMQENQQGFTLRTVEAMFFNKKLITNNAYLKQCDFYEACNIYVLGQEQRDLATFLQDKEGASWSPEIMKKHSFEQWLANFDQ